MQFAIVFFDSLSKLLQIPCKLSKIELAGLKLKEVAEGESDNWIGQTIRRETGKQIGQSRQPEHLPF